MFVSNSVEEKIISVINLNLNFWFYIIQAEMLKDWQIASLKAEVAQLTNVVLCCIIFCSKFCLISSQQQLFLAVLLLGLHSYRILLSLRPGSYFLSF